MPCIFAIPILRELLRCVEALCIIIDQELCHLYRLFFHGSKFLQIAALKEFFEKILRICVAHVCDSAVAQILVE